MKTISLILMMVLCCFVNSIAQSLSVSPSTTASGTTVTVTGVGESYGGHIVFINGITGISNSNVTATYNSTSPVYYSSTSLTATHFTINVSNTASTAQTASIVFQITVDNDFYSTSDTRTMTITITVNAHATTYTNAIKSRTFQKNNCGTGFAGSSVTYTVPAGTYSSTISQADADSKATNDINTNGQSYANSHGTCNTLYYNVATSGTFQKNGCGTGYFGSNVTYTVPANTYSATSQSAANAQAQDNVYANGQAYADANGTCSAAPTVTLNYLNIASATGGYINNITFYKNGVQVYFDNAALTSSTSPTMYGDIYTVLVETSGTGFGSFNYRGDGNAGANCYSMQTHYSFVVDLTASSYLNLTIDTGTCY